MTTDIQQCTTACELVRKSAALRALHTHAHGCWQDGNFLKDISAVRQDLSQVVIVDNSPVAYSLQVLGVFAPRPSYHQVTCTLHRPCVLPSEQRRTDWSQLTKTSSPPLFVCPESAHTLTLTLPRAFTRLRGVKKQTKNSLRTLTGSVEHTA